MLGFAEKKLPSEKTSGISLNRWRLSKSYNCMGYDNANLWPHIMESHAFVCQVMWHHFCLFVQAFACLILARRLCRRLANCVPQVLASRFPKIKIIHFWISMPTSFLIVLPCTVTISIDYTQLILLVIPLSFADQQRLCYYPCIIFSLALWGTPCPI